VATAVPTLQKKRGAYYTPRPLADFLVEWAVRSEKDRILDPACGEAVFLESAIARLRELGSQSRSQQVVGFDVDWEAAEAARGVVPEATITTADFFSIRNDSLDYDAVVGNPPYIRYHHFSGDARAKALEQILFQGVSLTELTSSWAPFLVHATSFLHPNGRLAFVLPMELLVTDYAGPVRSFLQKRFAHVDILTFEERIFPGALVDAVLVMAEGAGPGEVRVHRLQNANDLNQFDRVGGLHASGTKWSNALIDQAANNALTNAASQMQPLGQIASVDIGVVTGANRFFLLSDAEAREQDLLSEDLRPAVARAQHIPGLALTTELWECLRRQGEPVWMFAPEEPNEAAQNYIRLGELDGVNRAYKCRVRKQWWRLRLPQPPDLLLSYMSNRVPQLVDNQVKVLSTNLLHNVRLTSTKTNARWISISWMNSATMLSCELSGRAYGGGVLKLETREAERVIVPSFDGARQSILEALSPQIETLLRERQYAAAADLIDPIVLADIPTRDRYLIRGAWLDLQNRRRGRSAKRTRSKA
jgi:adenine-specific DNA-methyltransferase